MTPSPSGPDPMCPRSRFLAAGAAFAILVAGSSVLAGPPAPRPAASRPATMVDPAVVPAGGLQCRHCGAGTCHLHRGHVAECRDGLCAPHCPVRPSQYGFYRTQWRRWPDQGVKPVSAEEAATPAPPPKSLVPSADEESPLPPADAPATGDTKDAGRTSSDDQAVRPRRGGEALPADLIPEAPAAGEPGRRDDGGAGATEGNGRVPPVPPGEQPVPPQPEPARGLPDQSSLPLGESGPIVEVGALRYPAQVGGSLAAGAMPWRLQPAARQRSADSARGL